MLPPLPPNISLGGGSGSRLDRDKSGDRIGQITNFSRPLPSSKSMPYLDPPSSALSPMKGKRGTLGSLTRSKRLELSDLEDDDSMSMTGIQRSGTLRNGDQQTGAEEEPKTAWSPWKDRRTVVAAASPGRASPLRRVTRGSTSISMNESRDVSIVRPTTRTPIDERFDVSVHLLTAVHFTFFVPFQSSAFAPPARPIRTCSLFVDSAHAS
jgi:hypothetical protein